MFKKLLLTTFAFHTLSLFSQNIVTEWNTPSAGNPFIPGYFADPTIRKFGDTYYIYATTDGTGNGYGPAQVWMSKDFVNWRNVLLNWPTTEVVWAPDVVQQEPGNIDITGLVPDRFVHNAITLDPQLFRDDDGSEYLYFGTWGIYKDFGCGVAKLAEDGKSFTDKKLILNTEIIDFFEAPFVFKKNGIYYFTYSSGSCHDDTYRVQYAISKDGPMGPYEYKGCIPFCKMAITTTSYITGTIILMPFMDSIVRFALTRWNSMQMEIFFLSNPLMMASFLLRLQRMPKRIKLRTSLLVRK